MEEPEDGEGGGGGQAPEEAAAAAEEEEEGDFEVRVCSRATAPVHAGGSGGALLPETGLGCRGSRIQEGQGSYLGPGGWDSMGFLRPLVPEATPANQPTNQPAIRVLLRQGRQVSQREGDGAGGASGGSSEADDCDDDDVSWAARWVVKGGGSSSGSSRQTGAAVAAAPGRRQQPYQQAAAAGGAAVAAVAAGGRASGSSSSSLGKTSRVQPGPALAVAAGGAPATPSGVVATSTSQATPGGCSIPGLGRSSQGGGPQSLRGARSGGVPLVASFAPYFLLSGGDDDQAICDGKVVPLELRTAQQVLMGEWVGFGGGMPLELRTAGGGGVQCVA